MGIFSKIGNALSSAYSAVKNTVSNIFTPTTPRGNTAAVANALDYNNPYNNKLQAQRDPIKKIGLPGPMTINSATGGKMSVNEASIPAPVSFKAGTTPMSTGGASGSWGRSDYSSPSYSTDPTVASASFMTAQSPVSQIISAGTLGSGTPSVVTPSAPTGQNYSSTALSGNIKVGANPASGLIEPQVGLPATGNNDKVNQTNIEPQSDAQKTLNEYLSTLRQPTSDADSYNRALRESGLQQATIQRNNTQNAINAITTQMNTDLLSLRGTAAKEGVTEAVYGGQQSQITREATIKLLPLQAQLAVDQGNVELAQENTNTLFKIYATDAKNSADFYNKQAEKVYEFLTAEQKKKIDEKVWQKNFNADLIKQESKSQNDLAMDLAKDGNMAGYRAITAIRPPTNVNSPTFAEDYKNYKEDLAEVVGRYGVTSNGKGQYNSKQLAAISKINQDVSKNATYSKTSAMRGYADNVATSLSQGTGVGDLAAINQFQKVIDEGAVTRDQDVKLIQQSQSLVNTLKTKAKKLEKGDQLSTDLRQQMRTAVENMYEKQVQALLKDPYISAKKKEAELFGLTAQDTILGELGGFTDSQNKKQSTYTPGTILNSGGKRYRVNDDGETVTEIK